MLKNQGNKGVLSGDFCGAFGVQGKKRKGGGTHLGGDGAEKRGDPRGYDPLSGVCSWGGFGGLDSRKGLIPRADHLRRGKKGKIFLGTFRAQPFPLWKGRRGGEGSKNLWERQVSDRRERIALRFSLN